MASAPSLGRLNEREKGMAYSYVGMYHSDVVVSIWFSGKQSRKGKASRSMLVRFTVSSVPKEAYTGGSTYGNAGR